MANNKAVKGRVVDAETGAGIKDIHVTVVDFDPWFNEDDVLKSGKTDGNGNFLLSYPEDKYRLWKADRNPDIVVQFFTKDGRLLHETPEVKDVASELHDVSEIKIHKDNIKGWLVTNATLNPENGDPVTVYKGNAIRYLVDGDTMFPAITQIAKTATKSINLMTLFFNVDKKNNDPNNKDDYGLITEFVDNFAPRSPPKCKESKVESLDQVTKDTLEEVLKDQAKPTNLFKIPVNVLVTNIPLSASDSVSEVNDFFEDTGVKTSDFNKGLALLHAKAIIQDGNKAVLMGSPIKQNYFSGKDHHPLDTRHKGSLIHDVSIEITGRAVFDISKTFTSVWKATGKPLETVETSVITEETGDNVASVQVVRTIPGGTFKPEDAGNEDLPHGETGILEAYQRAISLAKRFIYLENQYVTSPDIFNALITRVKDASKPKLQIIIVFNYKPDLPGYADLQIQYINRLKIAVESNKHKLGLYTLWSRNDIDDGAGGRLFEVTPIYVHSKVAIIDDVWATVGSANLDGTSMNYHQVGVMAGSVIVDKLLDRNKLENNFAKFVWDLFWYLFFIAFKHSHIYAKIFSAVLALLVVTYKVVTDFDEVIKKLFDIIEIVGEASEIPEVIKDVFTRTSQHAVPHRSRQPSRSVEMNVVLYNGIADQPETTRIQELRAQLWQEHLGRATLPADMQSVPALPPDMKWVEFWDARAEENLQAIKLKQTIPDEHAPTLLKWVPETNAADYLRALKIPTKGLRDRAYRYDFVKCKYTSDKSYLPFPIPFSL